VTGRFGTGGGFLEGTPANWAEQLAELTLLCRHLIDVHDALRSELTQLRELIEQVAEGNTDPSIVRS
jgi:crotonobetainyl-CoA:carnitine CoA-transferase CaiB-like acyl-CoA transferase